VLGDPNLRPHHNGWDRAALRLAFSADLPTDVLYRTTKGTPDGWVRDIVTQNATEIRELLLDGALAREGLLDRQALAAALPGATTKNTVPTTLVLRSLCAETWTRNWLDTHQRIVS
jgi:asparagine synthase (glutamine-hydrolysing)